MPKVSFHYRPPTPHPDGRPKWLPFHAADLQRRLDEAEPLLRKNPPSPPRGRSLLRSWSFPTDRLASPPKATWRQSLAEQAAEEIEDLHHRVHEIEDRAQAGIFRLLMRAAYWKVRQALCC